MATRFPGQLGDSLTTVLWWVGWGHHLQRSRGLEPGCGQGWPWRVQPVRERGCACSSLSGPALPGGVQRSCRDSWAERTDPIKLRKEQSPLLRILSKSQQD